MVKQRVKLKIMKQWENEWCRGVILIDEPTNGQEYAECHITYKPKPDVKEEDGENFN